MRGSVATITADDETTPASVLTEVPRTVVTRTPRCKQPAGNAAASCSGMAWMPPDGSDGVPRTKERTSRSNLASRMAATASKFFSMNLWHLLGEFGKADAITIDLENDVVRPSLVLHRGEVLPPAPVKEPAPAPKPPPPTAKPAQLAIQSPTRRAWGSTVAGLIMIGVLFTLSRFAPSEFLQHSTVFVLACFVGWQVVWSVSASLHTPLMSVTNAISGIIIIGGMLQVSAGLDVASILGALAVLFAAINIAGGFLVTKRMLKMFQQGAPAEKTSAGGGHSR